MLNKSIFKEATLTLRKLVVFYLLGLSLLYGGCAVMTRPAVADCCVMLQYSQFQVKMSIENLPLIFIFSISTQSKKYADMNSEVFGED